MNCDCSMLQIFFNWFNGVIKNEYRHFIDVFVMERLLINKRLPLIYPPKSIAYCFEIIMPRTYSFLLAATRRLHGVAWSCSEFVGATLLLLVASPS